MSRPGTKISISQNVFDCIQCSFPASALLGVQVSGFGFRVQGFGFRIPGFRVSNSETQAPKPSTLNLIGKEFKFKNNLSRRFWPL